MLEQKAILGAIWRGLRRFALVFAFVLFLMVAAVYCMATLSLVFQSAGLIW